MSTPQQPIPFDTRPLTEPVDKREVRDWANATKSKGSGRFGCAAVIILIVFGLAFLFIGTALVTVVVSSFAHADAPRVSLPIIGVLVIIFTTVIIMFFRSSNGNEEAFRMARFASANNMSFVREFSDPPLPGMIFHLGSGRIARNLVRGTTPRFVEFGNHSYTVKQGKSSVTHTWGYVAVKLDVPLPNIVLDAIGNNTLFGSNLPARFERDQRLSLEGDFDSHFQLYCPEGYERDALYLFTPDIMARFIDNAAQLDAEIVDDWLFLYSKRPLSTTDPATWAWLFSVVAALMTKFDQWARWRDERLRVEYAGATTAAAEVPAGTGGHALPFAAPVGMLTPPPGVAREGKRLKRSTNWVAIVIGIAFAAFWIWVQMR